MDFLFNLFLILIFCYLAVGAFSAFIDKRFPAGTAIWQRVLYWPKWIGKQ